MVGQFEQADGCMGCSMGCCSTAEKYVLLCFSLLTSENHWNTYVCGIIIVL